MNHVYKVAFYWGVHSVPRFAKPDRVIAVETDDRLDDDTLIGMALTQVGAYPRTYAAKVSKVNFTVSDQSGIVHPGYQELKNLVVNDFGITKEYIEDTIKKMIVAEFEQFRNTILNEGYIERMVESVVRRSIDRAFGDGNFWAADRKLADKVNKMLEREVLQYITDRIKINFDFEVSKKQEEPESQP